MVVDWAASCGGDGGCGWVKMIGGSDKLMIVDGWPVRHKGGVAATVQGRRVCKRKSTIRQQMGKGTEANRRPLNKKI